MPEYRFMDWMCVVCTIAPQALERFIPKHLL